MCFLRKPKIQTYSGPRVKTSWILKIDGKIVSTAPAKVDRTFFQPAPILQSNYWATRMQRNSNPEPNRRNDTMLESTFARNYESYENLTIHQRNQTRNPIVHNSFEANSEQASPWDVLFFVLLFSLVAFTIRQLFHPQKY